MKIGFVGLGKMGSPMVQKCIVNGIDVVAYDVSIEAIHESVTFGAIAANSREDLARQLGESTVVWLMIPQQFVDSEINLLNQLLPAGTIVIDGGNSNFHDTIRRAKLLAHSDKQYVDVGTSGGILGATNGYSMTVGGDETAVKRLKPLFDALTQPGGRWAHVGQTGAGHYAKMVHNGIEYALMQSYAEGYDLLKNGAINGLDLARIAHVWQGGSIIQSRLNGLVEEIITENKELEGIDGRVASSGEGKWAYDTAEAGGISMPTLREALAVREASQAGRKTFATKLLAAMRSKFGGHDVNGVQQ